MQHRSSKLGLLPHPQVAAELLHLEVAAELLHPYVVAELLHQPEVAAELLLEVAAELLHQLEVAAELLAQAVGRLEVRHPDMDWSRPPDREPARSNSNGRTSIMAQKQRFLGILNFRRYGG